MLYVDAKRYTHAKLSVLYIYVSYHVIFLQFIIIKIYITLSYIHIGALHLLISHGNGSIDQEILLSKIRRENGSNY